MRGVPSSPNTPRVVVAMTDEDIIARVAQFCSASYQPLRSRNANHKSVYRVYMKGRKAVQLMEQLHPYMGKRRQGQIDRVMENYIAIPLNRGMYNPSAKLTEGQATEIKRRVMNGDKLKEIAQEFNVSVSVVREIKLGRTWKHINLE
jgi:hypothetical protein